MNELVATSVAASLRREDLHASLSNPILDTMNFLNEITFRYPKAISFARGRPYDGCCWTWLRVMTS
jgi:(S)-3,5-dihydroxyphenylglycine transaminase